MVHPRFGDLIRLDAVRYPPAAFPPDAFAEHSPCMIHVSVTARCNARCRGCVNSAITNAGQVALPADVDPERDSRAVAALVRQAPESEVLICLYGGEPLLRPARILDLMDRLEQLLGGRVLRYMLYTNGQLLAEIAARAPALLPRIWLLSVSIDGQASQHEAARPGTILATIEAGLRTPRPVAGGGATLMWSTLRESQSLDDCYEEFLKLWRSGAVNQFFWHWVETDEPFADLSGYMTRYEADCRRILVDYEGLLERGQVPPIPHLNELVLFLLTGRERGTSACAVEVDRNYDILGGRLHACADLPPEWSIGTIAPDGTPQVSEVDLRALVSYKDDLGCSACGVHGYCGGRCPVQGVTASARRLLDYCQLMRLHVGLVTEALPGIRQALGSGEVPLSRLYEDSGVYAQFTDVTP